MKVQEDVLGIQSLHRQGISVRQIARRLGIHRTTVKKYLEKPGLVFGEGSSLNRSSKLDPFFENIRFWVNEDPDYTARWIFDRLVPMGFDGSYDIVKRRVRALKAEKQQTAYMRFETEPGLQAQVDFGDFKVEYPNGEVSTYYVFSMILGYSRRLYAEIIEHCDLPTFLDCHINAFKYFGGIPQEILYDRMKNVYIGKVAGKTKFNDSLTGFALHYKFTPIVAPAYASWIKGKVERPYRYIRENFWRGYAFTCLSTAQKDLFDWLKLKEARVHGTTHEIISKRFDRECPYLMAFPSFEFDTSYRIPREVRKDCTVIYEQNWYVVPHTFVGKSVLLRIKDDILRVFSDNTLLVTYTIASDKGNIVEKPGLYDAMKQDKEMNRRKYSHPRIKKGRAKHTISPSKARYEMDVEARSIKIYEECTA